MNQNNIVTKYGLGSLPRILDTINCFYAKFGKWPIRLLVDADMLEAIKQHHLTEVGWNALQASIEIQSRVIGMLIAEDDAGNRFEYDALHIHPKNPDSSADYWIWRCEVWPKSG